MLTELLKSLGYTITSTSPRHSPAFTSRSAPPAQSHGPAVSHLGDPCSAQGYLPFSSGYSLARDQHFRSFQDRHRAVQFAHRRADACCARLCRRASRPTRCSPTRPGSPRNSSARSAPPVTATAATRRCCSVSPVKIRRPSTPTPSSTASTRSRQPRRLAVLGTHDIDFEVDQRPGPAPPPVAAVPPQRHDLHRLHRVRSGDQQADLLLGRWRLRRRRDRDRRRPDQGRRHPGRVPVPDRRRTARAHRAPPGCRSPRS